MNEAIKLSERERKCLESLVEILRGADEGACIYFRTVAQDTGLTEQQVRRAVRSLARKGLAEYHRGLFDDDGFTAGSGYCPTKAGRALIEPCDICGEEAIYAYDGKMECQVHYGKSTKQAELPI